uniref:Uncharacterized protein n=1 Tax=Oryza nivara TaxID=4536 RepID=A0A0E0IR63_ORYNI
MRGMFCLVSWFKETYSNPTSSDGVIRGDIQGAAAPPVPVAAMAVRLKGLIWCTLTPKISMGTWLNMKVMPISVREFLLKRCARLVSTQVNNTTAIFSNISFSLSSGISESMTGHHAIRALLAWLCSAHHCHALHFLLSANPFWICLSSNPERTIPFS